MTDFKLSASLEGHDDDVKAVAFPDPSFVLSASRDKSVRQWTVLSSNPVKYDTPTFVSYSQGFVNSVAFVPPTSQYPLGLVVAGGQDAIIEVRQPGKQPEDNADALLIGHAHNVCALDVSEDGTGIVSGSWDTEARVWQVGKWDSPAAVLQGHTAAVWAVSFYDKDTIITGSADKNIHIYSVSGKLTRKLPPSPDIVRALCKLPPGHWSGANFAAAGNDGLIRFWTLEGAMLGELSGHENFIYSLAVLPTGEVVSAGEDRSVRIWNHGKCVQVITLPAISVWGVAACSETGDIVAGASDKKVRVFSRSTDRHASPEALQSFEDSVKASAIPAQAMGGDINKTDLPGPGFLTSKSGTKEGQIQCIKEHNGSVMAYQWSTAANQWVAVGQVVDSTGSAQKETYQGKEYDYVFSVDIAEGQPPLKLPYNTTQNPYEVAQKFIADNELPMSYIDQVVDFINKNSQGATIGQTHDQGSDPWGSGSRYRPGDADTGTNFTAPAPASRPKVLPQTQYLSIATGNLEMIRKKAEEFNQKFLEEGRKDICLNPHDLELLGSTVKQLDVATKKSDGAAPISNEGVSIIVGMATRWPAAQRLPALDLLRLLTAASEKAVESTGANGQNLVDILAASNSLSADAPVNNIMLAVRALANLFTNQAGRSLMGAEFGKVHSLVEPFATSPNRNLAIAVATLYINYSVLLMADGAENVDTNRAVTLLDELVKIVNTATDSEALYRALVGTGTLLALGQDFRDLAKEAMDLDQALIRAAKTGVEPRIKHVIAEIKDVKR
ncbi:PFU-domain-containing protein [Venturia nashicola]|uniref:PFU-domain-containing protein n=1 Tax=Venturia nashicola TaxID=86259 RepID=A0A4Z1NH52_9PEZI|nr:PFU-domain-containing protein [Venturia nashicola]